MSHSLVSLGISPPLWYIQVTIPNYVAGGETILQSEVDAQLTGKQVLLIFSQCAPGQNSLGAVLLPILDGGKIKLIRLSTQAEIASTTALNAVFMAIVCAQN